MSRQLQVPPSDPEVLARATETFRIYCRLLLQSFAKHGQGLRDTICGNFIARGMSCTASVFAVWAAGSEQDAWILHRSLVDRLLHLYHLGETDSFTAFEEFSFLSMYEARHRLLSDPEMRDKVPSALAELQRSDKTRHDQLAQKPRWHRPRPGDIAKKMDLGFLYRFGYDYASRHVHPMASDGETDFTALTSPPDVRQLPDATVVRNSILVQSRLVHEGLNVSMMRWRKIAYDFLDHVGLFLRTGDSRLDAALDEIGQVEASIDLCEPSKPATGG